MEYLHHAAIGPEEAAETGVAAVVESSRQEVRDDAVVQFRPIGHHCGSVAKGVS